MIYTPRASCRLAWPGARQDEARLPLFAKRELKASLHSLVPLLAIRVRFHVPDDLQQR
ncbi:hypothetical protein E2C01_081831 [Portunus trituberculatus]|uniref:Uncharacterized protein n=1 Tax=Portunus trituberculatus TaxID=210409 RepID=A0A5B7IZ62_PORTR|nr:hypothetical protein [Portunus trituberculatus]